MDEEGNQGYYLYNEATGEEKMFSVVEDERLYFLGPISKDTAQLDAMRKRGASARRLDVSQGAISGREVKQLAQEKGIPLKEALKKVRKEEAAFGKKIDLTNSINRNVKKGLSKISPKLVKKLARR